MKTKKETKQARRERLFQQVVADYEGKVVQVPENENYYAFSDGRVWSYKRSHFLKTGKHMAGYEFVSRLTMNGVKRLRLTHEVIAHSFLGPKKEGDTVNHIDGVKSNNHADNLEYLSHQENVSAGWRLGLFEGCRQSAKTRVGTKNGKAKLNDEKVRQILAFGKAGMSKKELATRFNISYSAIVGIFSGRTWKHLQEVAV